MKLLIVGYGRHGKDTVCDILKEKYGLSFTSSSLFCARLFIYDKLKNTYNYTSVEECYEDRHAHRAEWFNIICEYNEEDATRLGKEIFKQHDIYCGLRNSLEFNELKKQNVFDYSIWVDRSEHLPPESLDSNTISSDMCDFVLDNNGSLADLEYRCVTLYKKLKTSC